MAAHPETVITLTVRELVREQREAFQTGWWLRHGEKRPFDDGSPAHRAAVQCYPLPKVTRPRVVHDGDYDYKCEAGQLFWRGKVTGWWHFDHKEPPTPTVDRVKLWADLLANPNEEVEDDS